MSALDIHLWGQHLATTKNLDLRWTPVARGYSAQQALLSVRLTNWSSPPPGARTLLSAHLGSMLPEQETKARSRLIARAGSDQIEALLGVAGLDVPGAEIIVPAGSEVPAATYEVLEEREVAEHLAKAVMGEHGVSSLPGVQPKGALALLGGLWHRPRGSGASTHILKPTRADAPELVHDEALSSHAAAACGVDAAVCQVETIAGAEVLVVPRFDRRVEDDEVVRVHAEDGASALGLTPDDIKAKFGWHRPAANLRMLASRLTGEGGDATDLLRQTTVRVLLGDTDAHAKNHTLLIHPDGTVDMAPLYDASPHGQRGSERMAMDINGERLLERVTLDDVVAEAGRWGVRPATARREVARVREAFVAWLDTAQIHPLSVPTFEWVCARLENLAPPGASTGPAPVATTTGGALPVVKKCGAPTGEHTTCHNPTSAARCHLHR